MKYNNIIIIGTSHISQQSIDSIKKTVDAEKPSIIAVELDKQRLQSMLHPHRKNHLSFRVIRTVGLKGFLFAVVGSYIQKKLGSIVGVEPGSDMITAVQIARQKNIPLALIDQDIEVTLSKFSKAFTWKEKWRFFVDLWRNLIFQKRELKKWGLATIDLSKVPPQELISKFIVHIKNRYPCLYNVLIHERNIVMAKNLTILSRKNPDKLILAVVGAGHEEGMIVLMKKYTIGIVPRIHSPIA